LNPLDVCTQIGEVVWTSKQEEYTKKSSNPRICVLVEEISNIPLPIILPISLIDEEVEIVLEYKGIPQQCSKCKEMGHKEDKCNQF
jgi:hypothetical protein